MAGAANPAMTVNPFQQASAAQSQALATYANPSAAASSAAAAIPLYCSTAAATPTGIHN